MNPASASFAIRIAGVRIDVSPRTDALRRFCTDYLTEEPTMAGEPSFCVLLTEDDLRKEESVCTQSDKPSDPVLLEELALLRAVSERMPAFGRFLFHGSAVALDGEGYLFAALSGGGKSTHAALWLETFGGRCSPINDDKPFLGVESDEKGTRVTVYGSPWNGKHRRGTNASAPLKGICFLTKANANSIARSDRRNLLPALFAQTYRPYDPDANASVVRLLTKAAECVPLWELSCDRSSDAARLSASAMTGVSGSDTTDDPLPKTVWQPLLLLLRNAADGRRDDLSVLPDDWGRLLRLAKKHSVAALLYAGLSDRDRERVPEDVRKCWEQDSARALRKEILFDVMRGQVFERFEAEGIRYLPLKGILLKDLYPVKGTREFADHDILYDESRQADVQRIFTELGFRAESLAGVHDTYRKEPVYNFELHKRLFPDSVFWAHAFADVWAYAFPAAEGSCACRMKDSFFRAYTVAHLYKHYRSGGSGLRSFTDLYILGKTPLPEAEQAEEEALLRKAGLIDAAEELTALTRLLFETPVREIPYDRIQFCLESGTYGTFSHQVAHGVSEQGKRRYLLRRAFPSYALMKERNPVLKKAPVLLPFVWAGRLGGMALRPAKRRRAGKEIRLANAAGKNSETKKEPE